MIEYKQTFQDFFCNLCNQIHSHVSNANNKDKFICCNCGFSRNINSLSKRKIKFRDSIDNTLQEIKNIEEQVEMEENNGIY